MRNVDYDRKTCKISQRKHQRIKGLAPQSTPTFLYRAYRSQGTQRDSAISAVKNGLRARLTSISNHALAPVGRPTRRPSAVVEMLYTGCADKNNPIEKIHSLPNYNRLALNLQFYRGGFTPHMQQISLQYLVFTARRLAKRGICRRRVSVRLSVCVCVCVCVRHTPVLYQNG